MLDPKIWRSRPTEIEINKHHAKHASVRGVSWWVAFYPEQKGSECFTIYSMGDGKVWLAGGGGMVSPTALWSPRDTQLMPVDWPDLKEEGDMKLFLDDQWEMPDRFPGAGWTFARTVTEAKQILIANQGQVTTMSLDSDLAASDGLEGPDLTAWLSGEFYQHNKDYWPTKAIYLHTRNSQGRSKMRSDITNPRYNPRPHILVGA